MVWMILAAILVIALFCGLTWLFRFAFVRGRFEGPGMDSKLSVWYPFRERMEAAQNWIAENTAEEIEITSFDGLCLRGIYIPAPQGDDRGVMIVFHGYRSSAEVDFAPQVRFLQSLGYHVILPYQRSHGKSEGKYITYGVKERYDCQSWANYAAARFGEEKALFLGGISMGCATVLLALDLELPKNLRGVMADCGFTSPYDILRHVAGGKYHLPAFPVMSVMDKLAHCWADFSIKECNVPEVLEKTPYPILFFHGEEDRFVPTRMTLKNYEACRSEKEIHVIPGAAHAQSFCMDTPRCEEAIRRFVREHEEKPVLRGKPRENP